MEYIINPNTKRKIKVGGPVWKKLSDEDRKMGQEMMEEKSEAVVGKEKEKKEKKEKKIQEEKVMTAELASTIKEGAMKKMKVAQLKEIAVQLGMDDGNKKCKKMDYIKYILRTRKPTKIENVEDECAVCMNGVGKSTTCCKQPLCTDCYVKMVKYECPYCRAEDPLKLNQKQMKAKDVSVSKYQHERTTAALQATIQYLNDHPEEEEENQGLVVEQPGYYMVMNAIFRLINQEQ